MLLSQVSLWIVVEWMVKHLKWGRIWVIEVPLNK